MGNIELKYENEERKKYVEIDFTHPPLVELQIFEHCKEHICHNIEIFIPRRDFEGSSRYI